MGAQQQGFLLIADITGYTAYLNQSELEHAHEVLQTLLELLIEHTRPPLVISRLAGDAVISYGLQDGFLSGQTFIEMIEDTYVAFKSMVNRMVLNNTCQCNACANISSLDLKFFVHYASFTLQKLDAHAELLGQDVIVIHRLLKNTVRERTGFKAYTLYTEAAIRKLGIEDISESMTPHSETYELIGEVRGWVQDMAPVWAEKKEKSFITVPKEDALAFVEGELPISVTHAWELVTHPEYRALLMNSVRQEVSNTRNGRLVPGSAYHCYHGNGSTTNQLILEWVPFQQVTTEDTTPVPKATVLVNIRLTPKEGGTNISVTCGKARGPFINRILCNLVGKLVVPGSFRRGFENFRKRVEEDLAGATMAQPLAESPAELQLEG